MKKLGLIVAFSFIVPGLYAQQVQPPAAEGGGVARVILPNENAAPAAVKVSTAASAAKKDAKAAAPAKATVSPGAAKAAVSQAPKPAAVLEKSAPAVKPAAAKPPAAVTAQPAAAAPVKSGFVVGKTHTVSGGDTLWDLSGKYYKDPFKWGKIYNANLGTVADPDRIYPKAELIIPDITEEVKPEVKKAVVIDGADTVKEAEFSSADVAQPVQGPAPAAVTPAAPAEAAPAAAESLEALSDSDADDLSQEMPEHQKEWASGVKIAPDDWREDGVITAKEKGSDDSMADGFSMAGEVVSISMDRSDLVKQGDQLTVYLKGADAFDKTGHRLGRELQKAGLAEVVSVDGSKVKARIIDAVTPISRGYIVKKK